MKDSVSSIFKSAAHFLTGTVISRLTGLLRDISIAFAFGASVEVAAFLVSFRLSHLARRLLGEGALQQAFIPLFEEVRKEDELRALAFFRTLARDLSIVLFCLVLFSSIALLLLHRWIDPDNQEIIMLTILMLPSLVFICLFGLNASLLQCERRYFAPAIAPVAFNLVWVVGAICLHDFPQKEAMRWMALVINFACLGQWLLTIPFLKDKLRNVRPLKELFPPELKKLLRCMGLGVVGVGAVQINNAIDPLFARFAELAGPAWLWFAIRIEQFPLGVFAIALSTALLPPLSRAIRNHEQERFLSFLTHAVKKSGGLMIPLSFLMIAAATPLVAIIYGYGEFDVESTAKTADCLIAYTIGLAPSTFVLILASAFFAQNDYKTPAIGSSLTMLSNLITNTCFIFFFGLGAISVALSTSISATLNALYLFRRHHCPFPLLSLAKTFIASLTSFLATLTFSFETTHPVKELAFTSAIFLSFLVLSGWALKAQDLLFWETNAKENLKPNYGKT